MKLRIASLSFLLGSLSTGISWLTLQPPLVRLVEAVARHTAGDTATERMLSQLKTFLPFYLAIDLLAVTALCYLLLYLSVGRPLRRAEEEVDQISHLRLDLPLQPSGGPLVSRLQRALRRMAGALLEEQAVTRRQQTELVASERLATVGKLAAGVAHEVGNPLAGILGYLSLVRSRAGGDPEIADLLSRLDSEVQRIDQIVRGLLDLGRPARGNPAPVEVAPIAETCSKLLAAGPELAQVRIELAIEPGTVARAEPGPLSQVLLNLLLNAGQAMGGQGAVTIRGRREGGRVVLEVQDGGPGIPPEALPHLFEPFFTTKPAGKGTGLGLAVSRHLLAGMGGELTASNLAGGGACFTVTLPVG